MKPIISILVITMLAPASAAPDLLQSIQGTHRTYDLPGFSSLTEGSLYLMIAGGFSGELFEFADLNKNERTSLTIGKHLAYGDMLITKKILLPLNDAFRDPSLSEMRTAIRKLINAKLPSEVDHISEDDSLVIFVAEKRNGKLLHWAREDVRNVKVEPEFLDLIEKAKAAEKLIDPTVKAIERTPVGAPIPAPAKGNASENLTVKAMQASIRAGNIREFTYDQVTEWRVGTEENINGNIYQSGLVDYKADTIFGVKTLQAKALVKNGTVVRWIWPKSGREIK